jgi:hypothetical protein
MSSLLSSSFSIASLSAACRNTSRIFIPTLIFRHVVFIYNKQTKNNNYVNETKFLISWIIIYKIFIFYLAN